MNKFLVLFLLVGLSCPVVVSAKEIRVTSVEELRSAVDNAAAGDVIVVADGLYSLNEDIVVNKKGTKAHPIIIHTEHFGGAEITGDGGFRIAAPASYII